MGHREVDRYKGLLAYWEYNTPGERFYGITDVETHEEQYGGILFDKRSFSWIVSPSFSDKQLKYTSRDDREGVKRALMWVSGLRSSTRVASRFVSAKTKVLDTAEVKTIRKEFLTLMKNVKVVKDFSQALRWKNAVKTWKQTFEDFFYKYLPSTLQDLSRMGDTWLSREWANYWTKRLKEDLWDLIIHFQIPLEDNLPAIMKRYPSIQTPESAKEYAYSAMVQKLPKWDGQVRRASRKAWKTIEEFLDWVGHKEGDLEVDLPSGDEHTTIDGFNVTIRDFDASGSLSHDSLVSIQEGLKRYRNRASKVLPLLLKSPVPFVFDFKVNFQTGGQYFGDHIVINAHTKVSDIPHFLAHETAHHIYKTYLSGDDKEFWQAAITGNYGTLDLWAVWKKYGSESSLYDNDRIRHEDPILYLQIQGLYHDQELERVFEHILSMEDLKEYLDEGGDSKVIVHGKPITGYAHKNPEEAFCEAIGMLVGYGPQAVLPEVRSWLRVIVPTIKIARKSC